MDLVNNSPMLSDGTPNPDFQALGTDGGWGFGWEDMTIVKFGLMYELQSAWTLYGGYSYGKQPVPESEVMFNILAPGIIESHVTVGFSKSINKSNEVMVSFMYAPEKSVLGPNPFDPAQTIEIKMSQFQIEIGYGFNAY